MKKILFLVLYSLNTYGMCDFPHNPAVYCLEGKVSNLKKYNKSKAFKCVGDLKIARIIRPVGTYSYNDNLDLITYEKNTLLDVTKFKNKVLYAKNCEILKDNKFTVVYSCYDSRPEFKDFTFLALDNLKQRVTDPWKQEVVSIDCESPLKSRGEHE